MPADFNVVVDANVLKGFFEEVVGGGDGGLTASAVGFLQSNDLFGLILVDEGGQIESEWRRVVDPQWFSAWFDMELQRGFLSMHVAEADPSLSKDLDGYGFPKGSKDVWYIRLAKSAIGSRCKEVSLVSEDLDFYQPSSSAKGEKRIKLMKNPNAPVRKYLRKKHDIHVSCVEEFYDLRA